MLFSNFQFLYLEASNYGQSRKCQQWFNSVVVHSKIVLQYLNDLWEGLAGGDREQRLNDELLIFVIHFCLCFFYFSFYLIRKELKTIYFFQEYPMRNIFLNKCCFCTTRVQHLKKSGTVEEGLSHIKFRNLFHLFTLLYIKGR